ncbi:MAG: PepSY domain-containing protein [Methylophaga sp.]|nr:PepSY domain-containing protein [Methylophaga sp.]
MMRQLFLWHRWLGIILCLFMAAWFVSGIVMLYVGYPKLTPAEHLERLPALSFESEQCCISVASALKQTGQSRVPEKIRLSSIAGQPHYLFSYRGEPVIAVHAETGERRKQADSELALASASAFFQGNAAPDYLGLIDRDVWTQSRGLDRERPLHVVRIHDEAHRWLYISSHSGLVIRDATRVERTWGWIGAWLHWLYPVRSLSWWAELVIYLSLAGTFMAIIGQVLGIKRWRFSKTFRSGSHSPYPAGFSRWHHVAGLLFGVVLIAFIFSGLMSMSPWNVLSKPSSFSAASYQGDLAGSIMFDNGISTRDLLKRFYADGFTPHELEWNSVAGEIWVTAYDSSGQSRVLNREAPETIFATIPVEQLISAASEITQQHAMQTQWLTEYDFYHVSREQQSMYGSHIRPLPMLRIKFDDADKTWFHINPYNGEVLQQLTQQRRINRWLFNLLHSWDWHVLLARPWLREALVIAFSIGGLIISISGVVMGYRRLKRQSNSLRKRSPKLRSGLRYSDN